MGCRDPINRWKDIETERVGVSRVGWGTAGKYSRAMLNLMPTTRVFVALAPVDFRLGFNGLSACVQGVLGQEVMSGCVFVFVNKSRNRIKLLWWDGSGLILCAKRLERGRFSWPLGEGKTVGLRSEELTALITGLEIRQKPGWYRR